MLVPIWMGICMASLGEVSAHLLPLIYQILDFIYWTVLIFIYLFWMTWHWKPAIVSCATTVFVSITQRLPTALRDHPSYGSSALSSLGQTAHNAQLLTADVNINRGQEHGFLQRAVVLKWTESTIHSVYSESVTESTVKIRVAGL